MSDLLNSASLVLIPSGYAEDKVYSAVPTDGSGDLSFTRSSNGTRINSAGLVEVVPWNLLTYSEDFTNADWNKSNVTVTSNDTTAPNGTTTADKIAQTSGGYVNGNAFGTGGNSYIFSVYLKAGSVSSIRLRESYYYGTSSTFNLSSGTASGTGIIESVGNGWFRCSLPQTYLAGEVNLAFIIDITTVGNYYAWGAQLNIGSTAKPYFPTTDRLNVPRLTYQNGGGGCPSLLLEKQSTNLALWSEDYSNAVWNKVFNAGGTYPVVTANYGISPDGTQNADRIQLARTTTSNSYSIIYQTLNGVASGQTYTWSVWLKSLSGTPTIGIAYDGAGYNNPVTLTTEWQRHYLSITATGTLIEAEFLLYQAVAATSLTADFLAWGFQVEASSYPTSYIPTTSASATRVADACSKTGISSLIGQTEGVLFTDFVCNGFEDYGTPLSVNNGSTTQYIWITTFANGNIRVELYDSSVQASVTYTGGVVGQRYKVAFAYKTNDFAMYVNGSLVGTDVSGNTFSGTTLSRVDFNITNSALYANAVLQVNQSALFKTRLSNSDLIALTTL